MVALIVLSLILLGCKADGFVDVPWLVAAFPIASLVVVLLIQLRDVIEDLATVAGLAPTCDGGCDE